MRLAKDRSGRVPFSIVAVVILVGSVVTGAYMQQAGRVENENRGRSAGIDVDAAIPQLRSDLEEIAARCIEAAVHQQTTPDADEGYQGLWRVDQNFRYYFGQQVRQEWGQKRLEKYCLTVEAGNAALEISTLPMNLRAINRLGMAVNMTAPAGFRIGGAVNFTFTLESGQKLQKKVDFELSKTNWYPLALFQANRLRRDSVNEGLLELLFKEMFRGFLDTDFEKMLSIRNQTRRDDPKSTFTVGDLWKKRNLDEPGYNAVDLAMKIEEQALFGESRGKSLNYYMNLTGNRPLDLYSALEYPNGVFNAATAFNGIGDDGLDLDLGPFFSGVTLLPLDGKGAGADKFRLLVNSLWMELPQPEFRKLTFAGEEERVDVYMLEVTVNGVYRLMVGPDERHLLELDIPVHLQFTVDRQYLETNRPWSEEGRFHCEIEDLDLFNSEYAGLYCRPVALVVDISNSTDVRAREMPGRCTIDLSLDGDYLGTFRRGEVGPDGLVLLNVPSGPHQISVLWNDGLTGEQEQGSATAVLNDTDGKLEIGTEQQLDTSLFWTYALGYIRDTPSKLRLSRLVEFLSIQAGYPVPHDAGSTMLDSPQSAQFMQYWLAGMESSLGSTGLSTKYSASADATVLKGASCVVKVIREALKWMEKVDKAVTEYNKLHPAAPTSVEPSISYASGHGAESFAGSVEGEFGKESLAMDRPGNAAGWKVSRSEGGSSAESGGSGKLGFGAAMDIGITITVVVSAYFKYVKYQTTDGISSLNEKVDLSLECLKVTLQVTRLMVQYVLKSVSGTLANNANLVSSAAAGLGVVIAVITIVQLILEENQKFRGDSEAWKALFTGLDMDTVTVYLSIAAIALGIIQILVLCGSLSAVAPYLAPLWALVALISLICFMFLDWNAFSTMVSGVMTDSDRDNMANSIEGTLRDTARTISRLNEYPADAEMLSARQARGAASLMAGMASFVDDPKLSFEMRNLSRYQYDTAWAREQQARAARSLRFFNIALWKQVDEFGGADWTLLHPNEEQKWDSRIMITWPDGERGKIELDYIQTFLLGLNASEMDNTKIDFEITGRVVVDRLSLWMDPLARIGDQVKLWNKRLAASQTMKTYLFGLNSVRHQNDWGLLRLQLSPTYTSCTVKVTKNAQFDFQDGSTAGRASVLQKAITRSDEPSYLYLEPGTYTLEFSDQKPALALKDKRATVKVVGLYSPDFGQRTINIMPEPDPIYFQIKNGYNGSIRVRADVLDRESNVVGALGTVFEYNNTTTLSGKEYINDAWVPGFCFDDNMGFATAEQTDSLSLHIRFTVELDRDNDGIYELTRTRTVYMNDIRNDQKAKMNADDGKHDDQLGYYLSVLNEPFMQKYGEDTEGNDLLCAQYLEWRTV